MGRLLTAGLCVGVGFFVALALMPEPRERTATVQKIVGTDERGVMTVTVQVDGLDDAIENAGEAGHIRTAGKTATVKVGRFSAKGAAVGRKMVVIITEDGVYFWQWK